MTYDGSVKLYSALVDLAATDTLGFTFSATFGRAGETPFNVDGGDMNDHSSRLIHHAPESRNIGEIEELGEPWDSYVPALQSMEITMQAEAGSASWDDPLFSVTFDHETGKYTFANATVGNGVFTITWANAGSRKLFGFASLTNTGASSYVSDYVSSYCIVPSDTERSLVSREYEPESRSSMAIPDNGTIPVGVMQATVPMYFDWVQEYEPQGAVFTADATANTYFTWQQFWTHCKQRYPFVVVTATNEFEAHILRETAAAFNPEPIDVDYPDYWHLGFECHFMGRRYSGS